MAAWGSQSEGELVEASRSEDHRKVEAVEEVKEKVHAADEEVKKESSAPALQEDGGASRMTSRGKLKQRSTMKRIQDKKNLHGRLSGEQGRRPGADTPLVKIPLRTVIPL